VSTRVTGIPEVVRNGRTGLLIEPGDPTSLAECLRRLLHDGSLRNRLALAARRKVERDFNCINTVVRLQELWNRAISQRRGGCT